MGEGREQIIALESALNITSYRPGTRAGRTSWGYHAGGYGQGARGSLIHS